MKTNVYIDLFAKRRVMKFTLAGGFHLVYQVLLIICLPFYFYYAPPKANMIIATIILFVITEMALTAGYHRFYSHRTYKPNKVVEAIMLFFGTMTVQSSVLDWANNHSLHHRFTDKERDPHSIKKGFWYAHIHGDDLRCQRYKECTRY